MSQFTSRRTTMLEQECLDRALRTFFRMVGRDRDEHFWWPGMVVHFRPEALRQVDGEEIRALHIGDLSFHVPTDGWTVRIRPEPDKWESLLVAIRHARELGDRRTHLLVNGRMPFGIAEWLRATPGCRELPDGRGSEFLLDLRPGAEAGADEPCAGGSASGSSAPGPMAGVPSRLRAKRLGRSPVE